MHPIKRIMLVDDNNETVRLTLAALEEYQLAKEVIVVRDGGEALEYLHRRGRHSGRPRGSPVVILVDLKAPALDGLEVLRRIKSDPSLRQIPVVMLALSRKKEFLVRSYALGANAYLVKPAGSQQFVDSVKQMGFFWAIINEPPLDSVRPRRGR